MWLDESLLHINEKLLINYFLPWVSIASYKIKVFVLISFI